MKINLFWKIISILFLAWLFLWLWSSSIVITTAREGTVIIKTNKLTGHSYRLFKGRGWERWDKEYEKSNGSLRPQ